MVPETCYLQLTKVVILSRGVLRRRIPTQLHALPYQDDFETPGISPRSASPRKHRRHTPNLRRKARGRPHRLQRLCRRVENLGRGFLASRANSNFF